MKLQEFYQHIAAEQKQIETTLSEMKEQGKEKTVRYKEFLFEKLLNNSILEKIKKYL